MVWSKSGMTGSIRVLANYRYLESIASEVGVLDIGELYDRHEKEH